MYRFSKIMLQWLLFIGVLAGGLVLIQWALPFVMPFFVGFSIAFLLRPLVRRFQQHSKIHSGKLSLLVLILFYSIVLVGIILLSLQAMLLLQQFFIRFPAFYSNNIHLLLTQIKDKLEAFAQNILGIEPSLVNSTLSAFASQLQQEVASISKGALGWLAQFAARLPAFFINCGVAVLCSIFVSWDYDNIRRWFQGRCPQCYQFFIEKLRPKISTLMEKTLKAYAILTGITFCQLFIGFLLLRVESAFQWALIVAFIDLLPILGCGSVLVPWAILQLFLKNYWFGCGILLLYAIIALVRQMIEPKILGKQLGLHPLAVLFFAFVGGKLFGFVGLILTPIIATILLQSGLFPAADRPRTPQNKKSG